MEIFAPYSIQGYVYGCSNLVNTIELHVFHLATRHICSTHFLATTLLSTYSIHV